MKIHRLTALLLSLLLLFSCALAESTDDKLMATVNGEELRYSAYVTYLTQYQQLLPARMTRRTRRKPPTSKTLR